MSHYHNPFMEPIEADNLEEAQEISQAAFADEIIENEAQEQVEDENTEVEEGVDIDTEPELEEKTEEAEEEPAEEIN